MRTLYYGLEQKTNFKFVKQSVAKLNYRYRFRKRGYTLAEDDDNTYIVPNDESKRSLIMERNASKYRLKFIK